MKVKTLENNQLLTNLNEAMNPKVPVPNSDFKK